MAAPLLIGVSARIHHPTDHPVSLGGVFTKTLHYLEQSVAHWVMSKNVLVMMIPSIESEGMIQRSDMRLYHYADALDGLVLQGGADVAPPTYGEQPRDPAWAGDAVRDRFLEVVQRLGVDAAERAQLGRRMVDPGRDADEQRAGHRVEATGQPRTGARSPRG